jgi:tripartite-type tricarboxylate transporter receptor subunit TctC
MSNVTSKILTVSLAAFFTIVFVATGHTQTKDKYPNRPITVMVNFGAGGSSDLGVRTLMTIVEKDLGVPMNIINRPGAGGWVGWTELLRSKPDGYTISLINTPNLITGYLNPELKRKENLDSFALICNHVTDPGVIAIRVDEKRFTNMKELVDYAKKNELTTTSTGIMGDDHIAALKFNRKYGTKFEAVHNKGANESITTVLGGHVDVMFANVGDVTTLYNDNGIKVLGVMAQKRSPLLSKVPTLKELGYDGVYSWSARGYAAPKGTPPEIIATLNAGFKKAMLSPGHMNKMNEMGLQVDYQDKDEF